jgi:hypothetical protein
MLPRAACAAMLVLGATAFHAGPGRPACRPWGGALRACRGAKPLLAGLMAIADAPPRCTRRFEFVPYGEAYAGGEKSICADGLVQGADLHLTHWTNNKVWEQWGGPSRTPRCAHEGCPCCLPTRPTETHGVHRALAVSSVRGGETDVI